MRAAQQRDVDRHGEVDLARAQAEQERIDKQTKDRELYVFFILLCCFINGVLVGKRKSDSLGCSKSCRMRGWSILGLEKRNKSNCLLKRNLNLKLYLLLIHFFTKNLVDI